MSVNTANICPAVLTTLVAEGVQDESKINTRAGVTGALLSAENRTRGPQIKDAYSDGHSRSVRLAFKQRTTAADTTDMKDCGPGAENPYLEQEFAIDLYRQISWKVKESTVRTLCKEYSDLQAIAGVTRSNSPLGASALQAAYQSGNFVAIREMAQEFMYQAPGLIDSINKDLLAQFALSTGDYQGGATTNSYQVQASAANGGGPLFSGITNFKQDLQKIGWDGSWHIVGGYGAFQRIVEINGLNFCCSALGVNFSEVYNPAQFRWFVDNFIATDFGDSENDAVIFSPGSAMLIPYNEYVGNMGGKIDNINRMTIPMPGIPGLNADLRIVENGCDEDYDFIMGLHFGLYTAPLDMYKAGDRLAGVNGILSASFTQAS